MGVARPWTSMAGSVLPVCGGRRRKVSAHAAWAHVTTLRPHGVLHTVPYSEPAPAAMDRITTRSGSMREAATRGRRSAPFRIR